MRRVIAVAVCLLPLLLLMVWLMRSGPAQRTERNPVPPTHSTSSVPRTANAVSNPASGLAANAIAAAQNASTPTPIAAPSTPTKQAHAENPPLPAITEPPPQVVMESMRAAFRQYAARFNGNPVGTNPEITAALNGGNPKQVQFVSDADGLRVNARGELVDSWGTPFFFHQLSATEMEIHSAGPDRRMWTKDDLVLK